MCLTRLCGLTAVFVCHSSTLPPLLSLGACLGLEQRGKFPPFLSITPLIDFFGVVTGWPCLLPISDKVGTGFKSPSEVGGRRGETMRLTCLCCWTAVSDLSRSGVDVPSRQTWGHGGVSKTPTSTTHYRPHMCQLCCFFCEVFPPHSLGSFLAKGRFPLFPLVN